MATSPVLASATSAPEPVAILAIAREQSLSRVLMIYVVSGLIFMLLPGTFLGMWNLITISAARASQSVTPAWLQAHGHAQIFGWIGSFILGIGFYSIPKLLRSRGFPLWRGWVCWALWTAGVALRWTANVYQWRWRVLLPVSAGMELLAFLLFFGTVSGHRSANNKKPESWMVLVVAGTIGLFATLVVTLASAGYLAWRGEAPAVPQALDQRLLVLAAWGFLVSVVWGFSARWLPVFLGLRPLRSKLLLAAGVFNFVGVIAALAGKFVLGAVLLLCGSGAACAALRLFEQPRHPAKIRGVHASFPIFVRLAYGWLLIAAALGAWAASAAGDPAGIWGASRHALTVGFIAAMVFCIGQRILPAFSGMRLLFSSRIMFLSLLLLMAGCALRVSSEVLAYRGYIASAWKWLPVSAVTEMMAVILFALNIIASFAQPAPLVACAAEPAKTI